MKRRETLARRDLTSRGKLLEELGNHADDLVRTLKGTLANYRGKSDREGTIVAMYDTELFGHWWWEGPKFLYELGLRLAHEPDIECVSGGDLIDEEPAMGVITLPERYSGEGGYHYVWLNDGNHWTWEKLSSGGAQAAIACTGTCSRTRAENY